MDYDPFIKRQLASTQLSAGPYVVQIWSRYPLLDWRGDDTFVGHRVNVRRPRCRLLTRPPSTLTLKLPFS